MFTQVRRIDLAHVADLASAIVNLSDSMLAAGFRLVTTFVFQTQLILVYQKPT